MADSSLILPPPADLRGAKGDHDMRVTNGLNRLQSLKGNRVSAEKIDQTAQEFEALFISQMLQHMFAGVETNELFGGGEGEDMYKSLLIDEYGKLMAQSGGIGLADHVRREMLNLQEIK